MTRTGQHRRQTQETNVDVTITLDGTGAANVATGIGMLDHMLTQLSTHGLFDLDVRASGDLEVDSHHNCRGRGNLPGTRARYGLGRQNRHHPHGLGLRPHG